VPELPKHGPLAVTESSCDGIDKPFRTVDAARERIAGPRCLGRRCHDALKGLQSRQLDAQREKEDARSKEARVSHSEARGDIVEFADSSAALPLNVRPQKLMQVAHQQR